MTPVWKMSRAARPMIVVMTVGGGAADSRDKNVDAYATELLSQVIPMIDGAYRTRPEAPSRAIAGLSMGAISHSSSACTTRNCSRGSVG